MVRLGARRGIAVGMAVLLALGAAGSQSGEAVGAAAAPGPLPADPYTSTSQDYQRSQQASALLVRQCMAGHGHPGFPLDPRYPVDPIRGAAVGTEYGVLELDSARRWGYGWDPAKDADRRPKGRRMTSAEFVDFPACEAEAGRRLVRGIDLKGDWLYASTRVVEVQKAVERDPRLVAAWNTWSRCMAGQGFTPYPDPVAAYTDTAWHRNSDGNTPHTRRERATAVADVICKRRHHTVEIWHTVQAQKQAADIAQHHDGYARGLRQLRLYRANINEVLRTLG
ncbi:hypothetical protein [Actinacidiphila sp. bgisy144]|uniref:hypothetical protein n=1 Tax=Actinacidiphila sp. bgisy144 TaxID=3413791 RepID=UPI003EBFC90D